MKQNLSFWLGDETSLQHFLETEKKLQLTPALELQDLSTRAMAQASADEDGEFGSSGYMVSRIENLAVVSISGSLVTQNRWYNPLLGYVSYDEIRSAVFAAVEHSGVDGIVLNMDTPGGQASGISELSDFLSEVDKNYKPIFTYAGTTMASGGYWLGSVGREIYASKLATIGSIGVVTVHVSVEKAMRQEGIEVTVLRVGEFKALGSPYEKLDEKARSQIEGQMNSIYEVFLDTVAENRGTSAQALKKTAAEGRVFIGADSVTVGLVDRIASFDTAIGTISEKVRKSSSRQNSSTVTQPSTFGADMSGKKKVLTEAAVAAIASGVPEAEVVSDPNMVVDAEAEVVDEGAAAAAAAEEGAADAQPAEGAVASASAVDSTKLFDTMFNRISDLTVETASLKAKLGTAEQDRDKFRSSEAALIKIAVQSINRMQVSLGGAAAKMDDADAATVLEQYNRTYSLFNQRFRVGSTAQVPQDKDMGGDDGSAENSSVAAAVHRLTTSRVASKG